MEIKETLKKRLKKYHHGIWFMMIFLITLAIGAYITRILIQGSFQIAVDIPYADETQSFSIRTGYQFLHPLFLGPIFGVLYYVLMRLFLKRVNKEKGKNRYYIFAIEIGVVILVILNCIAHIFHLGMEYVNALDALDAKAALNSPYREMFIYAWYMDELLGHGMVHVTYFGYIILAILTELLVDTDKRMILDEYVLVLFGAYALGILNGDIAIQSESGILLLLLQIIAVAVASIIILVKKINVRYYPILLAWILSTIFIIYFNIAEIIEGGFLAAYPFW
ncbi:MAG: hypothetical protein ACOC44_16105 [Promethearchaeia archaeon]